MDKKLSLNETLSRIKEISGLTEIDFSDTFSDVKNVCIEPNELVRFLNEELNRLNYNKTNKNDRIKLGAKKPIVARGTLEKIISNNPEKTINNFIKNITRKPKKLFESNPKMEKSDLGRPQLTMNTGLPAITGIVYDKENGQFHLVSTCPGAGACMVGCYARKAFYAMDESKTIQLTQRLNLLLNHPDEFKQQILDELIPIAEKNKISSVGLSTPIKLLLRWNDAGDFFGKKYVQIAKEVTYELIKMGFNVKSYAYTKTGKFVLELSDKNFVVTFSTDANPKDVRIVNALDFDKSKEQKVKRSITLPTDVFSGFFIKKGNGYEKGIKGLPIFRYEGAQNDLKESVYQYLKNEGYDIDKKSLVYTYELPHHETKIKRKYNVIVLPTGDSDISAQREDVWLSILCKH